MNDRTTDPLVHLPADLASLDAELARMARRDASIAPRGLEDRIAASTGPAIEGSETPDVVYTFPGVRRNTSWWTVRAAVAAAVLAVSGALVYVAVNRSGGPRSPVVVASAGSVERDVDSWLRLTESSEDEISTLAKDSEQLDSALVNEPSAGAWFLEGEPL